MARYQFEPRAHTYTSIVPSAAKRIVTLTGGSNPRSAFQRMGKGYKRTLAGYKPRYWIGTNQPRTVTFSAKSDSIANAIFADFAPDDYFVRNIDTGFLV